VNREIHVVDSEVTPFGIHSGHTGIDCAARALLPLLRRNPELAARLDAIVVGSARMGRAEGRENGLAQSIQEQVGVGDIAGIDVHAYCASGNIALHEAVTALDAGRADVAVVVGVEHLSQTGTSGPLQPEAAPSESSVGFSPPVFFGLCADRYMHETGASPRNLAQVSVRNRQFAASNDRARFRDAISVDDVLGSRTIATPLTLLQCCPPADGAAAALLVAADAFGSEGDSRRGPTIIGAALASGGDADRAGLTSFSEDVLSGRRALDEAELEAKAIDVAEVHDAFTISQVIAIEDLGFRPRGEGWRHALDSKARPVINPSGGHLSRGHPLGATGVAQLDSIRQWLIPPRRSQARRAYGMVSQAGGLRVLGQMLSASLVVQGP
jgi:acetyl-CoA acyltransferase